MGYSFTSEAIRRGAGGNEGKRVPSGHNRRRRLATRSSGKQQAERTAVRAASIVCPEESPLPASWATTLSQASPPVGNDAPTPARGEGLQPYGALTLFFRWRKKSVQKKASGTATPGKSPLLPIFERGSSQCRAQHSWTANIYVRARSCSLFSSFKKGKAFSLRCLSPLCSGAVGCGHTHPLQVGMFQCGLYIFATQKANGISNPRWPF